MELIINKSGHLPALDGLRGFAIILVLIAHFVPENFYLTHFPILGAIITKLSLMGLTGVSLFFVLSGFLITGILLNAKNRENFFLNFYARRFLRIFPVYYLSLFLIFTILPLVLNFSDQSVILKSKQIWLWTYLSNFPSIAGIWNISDQFALGHFWSLSVEEHFYLLWPLIVFIADLKKLKSICKITIAGSLILGLTSSLLIDYSGLLKFFSWTTFTFSGALALGALLAIHKREFGSLVSLGRMSYKLLWIFGILFLIVGFIPRRYHEDLRGILAHDISWFFYAGLMIVILNSGTASLIYKVFTNKILLIFGKISYGIYVFHGILMPFFKKNVDVEQMSDSIGSPIIALIFYYIFIIGLIFLISWFSWILIERQILKLKSSFE